MSYKCLAALLAPTYPTQFISTLQLVLFVPLLTPSCSEFLKPDFFFCFHSSYMEWTAILFAWNLLSSHSKTLTFFSSYSVCVCRYAWACVHFMWTMNCCSKNVYFINHKSSMVLVSIVLVSLAFFKKLQIHSRTPQE